MKTAFIYDLFYEYIDLIRQVGAILIIIFGLMIVGVFQPKFLMIDRKINFKNRQSGYIGSILIGIGYAAGWTPCIGPILGAYRNSWFIDWPRFIIYDCLYSWVFYTFLNNVIFYRKIRMDKKI